MNKSVPTLPSRSPGGTAYARVEYCEEPGYTGYRHAARFRGSKRPAISVSVPSIRPLQEAGHQVVAKEILRVLSNDAAGLGIE